MSRLPLPPTEDAIDAMLRPTDPRTYDVTVQVPVEYTLRWGDGREDLVLAGAAKGRQMLGRGARTSSGVANNGGASEAVMASDKY